MENKKVESSFDLAGRWSRAGTFIRIQVPLAFSTRSDSLSRLAKRLAKARSFPHWSSRRGRLMISHEEYDSVRVAPFPASGDRTIHGDPCIC